MKIVQEERTNNQPNKLLTFRLYGSFAHFNQPVSNRFRNTYSIIPKPQLLGLVGSIVGLRGYKNKETIPEFYQKIGTLKVFVKPNNIQDRKFVVTYNSMNSFLNNRVDTGSPNVIINEQVLMGPDYTIGLLLDETDSIHKNIIENIRYNRSVFPIYFGKNEFFANIQFNSLDDYEDNAENEVICHSILPFDQLQTECSEDMRLELVPVGFNERFKYVYRLMAVPQNDCKIVLNSLNDSIVSNGNVYYVF